MSFSDERDVRGEVPREPMSAARLTTSIIRELHAASRRIVPPDLCASSSGARDLARRNVVALLYVYVLRDLLSGKAMTPPRLADIEESVAGALTAKHQDTGEVKTQAEGAGK